MNTCHPFARRRLRVAFLLVCAASVVAHAQQAPITGQMLATATPAANTAQALPTPPPVAVQPVIDNGTASATTQVSEATRQLLRMQVQGSHAGKHLPIPGQEASASYQRYLKSFDHPIPEFYDTTVSKGDSSSSVGSGSP